MAARRQVTNKLREANRKPSKEGKGRHLGQSDGHDEGSGPLDGPPVAGRVTATRLDPSCGPADAETQGLPGWSKLRWGWVAPRWVWSVATIPFLDPSPTVTAWKGCAQALFDCMLVPTASSRSMVFAVLSWVTIGGSITAPPWRSRVSTRRSHQPRSVGVVGLAIHFADPAQPLAARHEREHHRGHTGREEGRPGLHALTNSASEVSLDPEVTRVTQIRAPELLRAENCQAPSTWMAS